MDGYPIDPDQIAADLEAAAALRQVAALAGEFYDALRLRNLPETLAIQLVVDWHAALIDDGIWWEDDRGGSED